MDDWLDLIIFAVVIIANIIGGIIKIKQKKKAAQHKLPPPTNDDEFDEYEFEEEYSGEFSETESQYVAIPVNEPEKVIKNDVPCRETAAENTNNFCSKPTIEVTDSEDEESYVSVDDQETLNTVFEMFKEKFKDEFNFIDED